MSSSGSRFRLPHVSSSVGRIAAWNASAMVGLYILFNISLLLIVNAVLEDNLDARLRHEIEHILSAFVLQDSALVITHPEEFEESDLTMFTETTFLLQVYRTDGTVLLRSRNLEGLPPPDTRTDVGSTPEYYNERWRGSDWRVSYQTIRYEEESPDVILQLATSETGRNEALQRIFLFNLLTFPLVLVALVVLGIVAAQRGLRPLRTIIGVAKRISTTNLDERLSYAADPEDEMGKLRDTLNELFDRLQLEVSRIEEFTQNASHQLLTPLTAIRSEIDYLLLRTRTPGQYKRSLKLLGDRTNQLRAMVHTLLILTRESSSEESPRSVVNVSSIVSESVLSTYPLVRFDTTDDPDLFVFGRPQYVSMVIGNLVENALKYGSSQQSISVRLSALPGIVRIEVADQGQGISETDRERIFDRFYRGRGDASESVKGFGLGLSLVKTLVLSMKGTVRVEKNEPRGSRFIVELPRARLV